MTARAADPQVPDEQLTPVELAVRQFRIRVLDDLGGIAGLPLTRLLQVEALSERWLVKGMLSTEVMDLGASGRLVDRRAVRARPLLLDWLRVLDGYEKALAAVGYDPLDKTDPADTLEGIVAGIVAARPQGSVSAPLGSEAALSPQAPETTAPEVRSERAPAGAAEAPVIQPPRQAPEPVECRPATLAPVEVPDFQP